MRATPEKATRETLATLRGAIARLGAGAAPDAGRKVAGTFSLGAAAPDEALGGGLPRAALHEVFSAGSADAPAAAGFGLALALRAAGDRPIVWIRQEFVDIETGGLYAPGLVAFGLDPDRLILVSAPDPQAALRAAGEAARCPALGAVLIELFGAPKILDLTASRRLALAAAASSLALFAIRVAGEPTPSAAMTRWRVTGAASAALAANAPGHPTFAATLLRHRAGPAGRTWFLEWNRDRHVFVERAPLSGAVAAVPVIRPAASQGRIRDLRRTG